MIESNKILIAYQYTCFDKISSLIYFLKKYKKIEPGIKHKLLICLKLLKGKKLKKIIF